MTKMCVWQIFFIQIQEEEEEESSQCWWILQYFVSFSIWCWIWTTIMFAFFFYKSYHNISTDHVELVSPISPKCCCYSSCPGLYSLPPNILQNHLDILQLISYCCYCNVVSSIWLSCKQNNTMLWREILIFCMDWTFINQV